MTTFWVNEKRKIVENDKSEIHLLDYLRNDLKLTGTKCGCDDGTCGSCTVVIDGKATRSCHVKLSQLAEKKVHTIEGLSGKDELHPLQAAFVECGAIQCGFCTPGLIMASYALLENNQNPSEEEILKALKINLCRCGAYNRIVKAVQRASAKLRGEQLEPFLDEKSHGENEKLGKSVQRFDVVAKAKGETKFQADLDFNHMLHGKIVWSEHPHAEIISIDTDLAEKIPGVHLVLTSKDVPGENKFGTVTRDQPVLAEGKVRHLGEPVIAVFADDLETAEKAAGVVRVNYRELPGVFSCQEALCPTSPKIHGSSNLLKEVKVERGDLDSAFSSADIVVDEVFYTPRVEHAYIETEAAVSTPGDGKSRVIVYNGTQNPFIDLNQMAPILGLKPEEVIIRHLPAGGAFGGKLDLSCTLPLVAIATLRTGRPAKLALTRKESIKNSTKRHGFDMSYRVAADKSGKLLGMDISLIADAGAYSSYSEKIMRLGVAFATGPYAVPNLRINGKMVFTNNPVGGAMRGFGAYQTEFAAESAMDILSRKLNIDPILLREKNALDVGLTLSVGEVLTGGVAYKETLTALKPLIEEELLPLKQDGNKVGIGIASGWRSVADGCGIEETSGASLELLGNGKFLLKTGCTEMGQGTNTALCQIVAEVFGVGVDDVENIAGDTGAVPRGGGVSAQRGLYVFGYATHEVSKEMREFLLSESALILQRNVKCLDLINGCIVDKSDGAQLLCLKELAETIERPLKVEKYITLPKTYDFPEDANESGSINPAEYKVFQSIAYGSTAVAVSVNEESGQVEILKVIVAVDGGKILNPEAAKTQVEGATIMGMGHAMTEEFITENGFIKTDTLGKCRTPRITMIPRDIKVVFVEGQEPTGPFGSKGLSEIGILSIAPAITNAIYDATGSRVNELPVRKHLGKASK